MTLAEQARYRASPLCKFLDDHLPHREDIACAWLTQLGDAGGDGASVGLDRLGTAFEVRVGLDLANRAGWWPMLNFLCPDDHQQVLEAAGFAPCTFTKDLRTR